IALFQTEADRRAEIQIAEQEAYLRILQQRNTAEERLAAAQLASYAEVQRAAGDYFGFFTSQLQLAFGQASDFYGSLVTAARSMAQGLTSATSGFFSDFAHQVAQGKSVWESFTSALSTFWQRFLDSAINALSDFLASAVVGQLKGLLSGGGGSSGG